MRVWEVDLKCGEGVFQTHRCDSLRLLVIDNKPTFFAIADFSVYFSKFPRLPWHNHGAASLATDMIGLNCYGFVSQQEG